MIPRHAVTLVLLATLATALVGCSPQLAEPSPPQPTLVAEPEGPPVAQIIAVHGFNDRKATFEGFAAYAAERGIRLEAFDQQGFGANSNRGLWPGRDLLVKDLANRLAEARAREPEIPLYLIGESMGAAISAITLAEHPDLPVDGLVLSAPAVWGGDAMNPFYRAVLWLVARVAPGLQFTGEDLGKQASDNIPMLRELAADPLFVKETRVDSIEGLVGVMEDAREAGTKLHLPRLVLGGKRDEIVPPEALASFLPLLDPNDCVAILYEKGWHMLLRDLQRQKVWTDIIDWITEEGKLQPRADIRACDQPATDAGS
ncbi:MAG: alpha/beta hydrolase [Geminicoccaceae bacterium]